MPRRPLTPPLRLLIPAVFVIAVGRLLFFVPCGNY